MTCSIACAASAAADWIAPIWLGDLLGRPGGLAGERLHLRRDHRKAAAGFAGAGGLDGGVEREQVGLAGDRLDQPDHLADAGGGIAELDMVATVRCASETARAATSVDFVAWPAISPIEAASSSTELAAAVTFSEAAPTRSSAVRDFGGHRIGRAVELGRRRSPADRAAPRTLPSACSTELSKRRDGRARSFRCAARARALVLVLVRGQPLALDHVVAEHDHGPRHGADLVLAAGSPECRAEVSPSASRFIAAARPLSGRVMLRPISQLKPQTDQHRRDADPAMMACGFAAATP